MNKKLKLIAEAIQQYTKDKTIIDTVPEEWWSTEDYMKANDLSRSSANRHVSSLFRKGIVEKRNFRIRSGLRVYPVPHFRNLPQPKASSKSVDNRR